MENGIATSPTGDLSAIATNSEGTAKIANNILLSLQDYVILLNGSGHVVFSNKNIRPILTPSSRSFKRIGSDLADRCGPGSVPECSFRDLGCLDLICDATEALKNYKSLTASKCRMSILKSSTYPLGVPMQYILKKADVEVEVEGKEKEKDQPGDPTMILLIIRLFEPGQFIHGNDANGNGKIDMFSILETASGLLAPVEVGSDGVPVSVSSAVSFIRNSIRDLVSMYSRGSHSKVSEIGKASEVDGAPAPCSESSSGDMKSSGSTGVLELPLAQDGSVGLLTDIEIPKGKGGDLFTWEYNVLEIEDKKLLLGVLGRLLQALEVTEEISVDARTLSSFVLDVARNYHDNPFHNLHHGTCVSHFSFMLLRAIDAKAILTPRQRFAVLISAIVHDVDHPGNTNMFEINCRSNLALLYNDVSVLENHHCATAFQLMRRPGNNIFGNLDRPTFTELRKTMVDCILATDMAVHFDLVNQTKNLIAKSAEDRFKEPVEKVFLCKLLVHAADLSNPVRPFHMTQAWARRVSEEFNRQVDKEKEMDLPFLPFMVTPDDKALGKNEFGFSANVVAPMWRSIAEVFPVDDINNLIKQLDSNIQSWKDFTS